MKTLEPVCSCGANFKLNGKTKLHFLHLELYIICKSCGFNHQARLRNGRFLEFIEADGRTEESDLS